MLQGMKVSSILTQKWPNLKAAESQIRQNMNARKTDQIETAQHSFVLQHVQSPAGDRRYLPKIASRPTDVSGSR